jgi:uncharacterized protein YbjT (DUF2867 family)
LFLSTDQIHRIKNTFWRARGIWFIKEDTGVPRPEAAVAPCNLIHMPPRRGDQYTSEADLILITGAGGNVGKEVLKQAVLAGADIRAAYQSAAKADVPSGVAVAEVDFKKPETLAAALKGVERVFLVGPPTEELAELERKAVLVIAQAPGIKQVVKLSAMGGRGSNFTRLHAESEDYIRASGVPFTFLRPNCFMQNAVMYNGETIRSQGVFYGSEGDGKVSQVDIRDVAAVAVRALRKEGHDGKTYTLTGPEALTSAEAAALLSKAVGREIRFVNLPAAELKKALLSAGMTEWHADAVLDLQRFYREGKAAEVTDDVERVLGRAPIPYSRFAHDYHATLEGERVATAR